MGRRRDGWGLPADDAGGFVGIYTPYLGWRRAVARADGGHALPVSRAMVVLAVVVVALLTLPPTPTPTPATAPTTAPAHPSEQKRASTLDSHSHSRASSSTATRPLPTVPAAVAAAVVATALAVLGSRSRPNIRQQQAPTQLTAHCQASQLLPLHHGLAVGCAHQLHQPLSSAPKFVQHPSFRPAPSTLTRWPAATPSAPPALPIPPSFRSFPPVVARTLHHHSPGHFPRPFWAAHAAADPEPEEEDKVAVAMEAIDQGDLDRAQRLLMAARAADPHRGMPRLLHLAFCRLFQAHAAAHPEAAWPLEGLAALHTDAEEWNQCLDVCREASARLGGLSPAMRMKRFHAARAAFCWDDLDLDPGSDHPSGRRGLSFIEREAVALAAFTGADTVVPPFTALSMPLAPDVCASIATACLQRSVAAAARALGGQDPGEVLPPHPPDPGPGEPLVVGFITPDANGAHPLGFLMAGTFRHFAKHKVVYFAMCRHDGSAERTAFEVGADEVVDVTGWGPLRTAAEVRRRGVHVLVDLCGHAGTSDVTELMAMRPAALQINGAMGTPAPMGDTAAAVGPPELPVYDYAITDAVCVPDQALASGPEAQRWGWGGRYEHKALRLPNIFWVNDYARAWRSVWSDPPPVRESLGLPPTGTGVVLACMNRGHKIDQATFALWLRVLQRTSSMGTVLWVLAPAGEGRQRLRRLTEAEGVDPSRVVFADVVRREEHLHRLRAADLALDTRAYNSHTLGADYLWAGVPMVTALVPGASAEAAFPASGAGSDPAGSLPHEAAWASRVGAALVKSVGIDSEVVAADWDGAYEDLTVKLVLDAALRRRLQDRLAAGRSADTLAPLWDTGEWARAVEAGVDLAWPTRPNADGVQWELWRHIDVPRMPQVPLGMHAGKYDLDSRLRGVGVTSLNCETSVVFPDLTSDGRRRILAKVEDDTVPEWALRKVTPQLQGTLDLSRACTGVAGGVNVVLSNDEISWEPFFATLEWMGEGGGAAGSEAESLRVTPTNGVFAPRGGAENACDSNEPYSDSCLFTVYRPSADDNVAAIIPPTTTEREQTGAGGGNGEAGLFLVVRTEMDSWSWRIVGMGIPVRAIVLERSQERTAHFRDRIQAVLPEVQRMSAVDPVADPSGATRTASELGLRFARMWEEQATAGQVGCMISHARLWRDAVTSGRPCTIVLEDDAVPDATLFRPVVVRMLDELRLDNSWDLAYLYVHEDSAGRTLYPVQGVNDLRTERQWTQAGFHTWCTLAYVVSHAGAQRLLELVSSEQEEIYCPVDRWISDLRERGLLRVKCPTTKGWISNAGQVDMREQAEDGGQDFLASNIWAGPKWAELAAGVEDDQMALLEGVVQQLMDHVRKQVLEDGPVVELTSAEQLQKDIDFSIPGSTPRSDEELLQACAQILKKSVNTSHPNFHNQLFASTRPAALAGEFITAVTNASMYTYEVAPVFTIMERVVLTKMYEKLGWVPEQCDGIFNPGGSMSNFYGMNLARFWKCEKLDYDVKRDGLCGGPRLVAYYSDHGHYSALKGAAFLGIGTANLIKVKVNAKGEMIVSDLKTKIEKSIAEGKTPFFIQATAGTTVLGAYDPLNEICDVAEKHQMWVHVDGCWGASAVLSKKHRDLMAGVERCDSVAWNPHKMMGIPLQCAAFLTRHHGYLHKAHSSQAKYLFQKDKLNADLDTGDKSVQCGRKVDVLKLWMAWVATGDEGYEKHMDDLWEAQRHLRHRVDSSEGFELVAEPSCTNVCFWYVPPSLRKEGAPIKGSDKYNQIVHSAAAEIKRRMQEEGTMMVGFQSIPLHDAESPPNFFRMVIMGHLTSKATMDFVVDEIERLGADL